MAKLKDIRHSTELDGAPSLFSEYINAVRQGHNKTAKMLHDALRERGVNIWLTLPDEAPAQATAAPRVNRY